MRLNWFALSQIYYYYESQKCSLTESTTGQTNSIKYLQCNCLPGLKYTSVKRNPSNAEPCRFTSDSSCRTRHPGAMERNSGQCQRLQLLMLPTAALLLLQNLILLSSTTCLVLGPSSLADKTRAATPAKEQQDQLSMCVTSPILSSIPSASLWSMVLLSFCECTDGERVHLKESREGFWWSPWHWGMGSCLSPATWHCSGPLTLSKQLRSRGRPLMGSQETPASIV